VVGSGGLSNNYPSVIISNTSNAQNQLQGGAVYNIAGSGGSPYLVLNHNGAGHKILAWVGNPITVGQPISGVTFIAAIIFGPDTWASSGSITSGAFWDSYLPSNLSLQSSTDLSANFNGGGQDGNLANDNNSSDQNDNAVLNVCQGNIYGLVNPANWQSDANESKTHVSLNGTGMSVCSGSYTAGYTGLIE
jgi:hypothetical protein